jgi:type IV pilus assembly protein PilA
MNRARAQKNQGFSLLEMLMVIAVLAILAAVGIFNYNNYARSVRLHEVNNRIAQLFQETSARAINNGERFTIAFKLNQTTGTDLTVTSTGSTGIIGVTENITLENDAELTSVKNKLGDTTSIDFDARGRTTDPSTLVVSTQLGSLTGTVRLLVTGKTVIQ